MSADAWETCKENVLPLKRGRSAKGLTEAIQRVESSNGRKSTEEDAESEKLQAFERELTSAADDQSLLSAYIR